ncbi:MAG: phosphoribosyltransferase [Sphaerochaetaceae bacterium]|jgi:hypoxanthine phosphoribosyltransferase|nr:phosphoribosyltransferase [Sphaerochaetaceae bacterium]MDD3942032.1 phosphoribosyltransferase [Sphaerochaetaceae bacterium]MDX9939109.1 phosphoribosyltransferase [Sphaerochaetaceae bacterium]
MDNKYYVGYSSIHKLVKSLADRLMASGYDPDVIVAIGSGGFIPARIMKTYINRPIYAVGISYYGLDQKHSTHPQKIQWIDEAQQQLRDKKVLLIDEVDDTRATLSYCVKELLKNEPKEIAVLVLHNKKKEKDAEFPPEITRYFAGKEIDDLWIKYPWDAIDIEDHAHNEHLMLTEYHRLGKEQ